MYGQLVLVDPHRPLDSLPLRRARLGYPLFSLGKLLHRYDAAVTLVDDAIKRLDEGLKAQGRSERILMIVGDHGEGLFRPAIAGRSHARYLYDANLEVPWILNGPGIANGHVVQGLAESVDVIPTLLDLLDIDGDDTLAGDSWLAHVQGRAKNTHKQAVLSVTRYGPVDKSRITTPDWTYIHNYHSKQRLRRGRSELYHYLDYNHRRNMVGSHPKRARVLRETMEEWKNQLDSEAIVYETTASEQDLQQLQALGYVD